MTKYFTRSEFACPCCGWDDISPVLVELLDQARHLAGIPFIINSGCRCQKFNDSLRRSVPDSAHVKGLAADIACTSSHSRRRIVRALLAVGASRIGIASGFIHVDVDASKPQDIIYLY